MIKSAFLPKQFLCKLMFLTRFAAISVTVHLVHGTCFASDWIRPADTSGALVWGHKQGLVFGLPSRGGMPGPRGLIRIGVLNSTGTPTLINFIAVEPVTIGTGERHTRMGYSELEKSELDDRQGKTLWTPERSGVVTPITDSRVPGAQRLSVRIEVEPFTFNRARVYLVASLRSDIPHEIEFAVYQHQESAPIEELTLTSTMGNYMRLRHLWLANRVVDSRDLYNGYTGNDFVERASYPHDEMLTWKGDAIVLATTDEADPASISVRENSWWNFNSHKMTQYWRVPKQHIQLGLRTRVNGRRVYWASETPIPGGISYENFEVRQQYVQGQVFVFGLTKESPYDFHPPIVQLPPLAE